MTKPDRRKKFVELAERRVSRALKDLKLVGNLSNRSNYAYGQEDVTKIYRALRDAVEQVKSRFESQGSTDDVSFKL